MADITIMASDVRPLPGAVVRRFTVGGTMYAGEAVCVAADGNVERADANDSLQALAKGMTKYTQAMGIMPLREKIASFYQSRYGVSVSPQRIIITPGATGGLQLVLAALLNAGDEVLLPDPGYPCNRHYVSLFNALPVALNVNAENNYHPTLDSIKQHWSKKTRILMLASPANPTGSVLSLDALKEYAQFINLQAEKGHPAAFIVDEIYHGLSYGGKTATALSLDNHDNLFVINSFSKYFGMTGWRLGWVVAPDNYIEALDRLAQNIFLCAPTPSQYAAIAAFDEESIDIMEQRKSAFEKRRDFLLPALKELGFKIPTTPEGAFYLYANTQAFSNNSMQLASDILEKASVAITPGQDFGSNEPEKHVRFAYTTGLEQLEDAVSRLQTYLAS